uniref:Histidinol-phosphate aminotransferase n=1 Tax=Candidatus Kentrum sp. DK TaxID=2126562 RepID=A0A450SZQ3_9GAMM|nr:MAG: histidinol phosphate aminotransferase apoenzyme [Candidatus Kentron sp. DK]
MPRRSEAKSGAGSAVRFFVYRSPMKKPNTSPAKATGRCALEWIRPEIRALRAYHVPEGQDLVKLDAMENPYPWPEGLVEKWLDTLRESAINRYPEPSPEALKGLLRKTMRIPDGMGVLLGNGSDELIQLIAMSMQGSRRDKPRVILAPEPTFVMYRLIAMACGLEFVGAPLRAADFSLDGGTVLDAIEKHQPAVVFLAYPNNPTGNLFDTELLLAILAQAPGLVVIDEAYTPFAQTSRMEWLRDWPNLIILRTLSKLGFAGLRLGFAVGHPEWMEEMNKLRLPYNINTLTQASLSLALDHFSVFEEQITRIRQDREKLFRALSAREGVTAWPSRANFILFRPAGKSADAIHAGLREQGVLIKNLHGNHPLLENCLRVTVGTPEENQAFLEALGIVGVK